MGVGWHRHWQVGGPTESWLCGGPLLAPLVPSGWCHHSCPHPSLGRGMQGLRNGPAPTNRHWDGAKGCSGTLSPSCRSLCAGHALLCPTRLLACFMGPATGCTEA